MGTRRRRVVSALALAVWAAALVIYVVTRGFPVTTDDVCLWAVAGLLAAGAGDVWPTAPRLLRDWGGLLAVLLGYYELRDVASKLPWKAHDAPQIAFDRFVGGGTTMTERLQGWLYDPGHPAVYDYIVVAVYLSHFVVPFVVLAVLWRIDHRRFVRFMGSYLLLTFAGFATFVLFPAEPPWMAGLNGDIGPTSRVVADVVVHLHLHLASAVILGGEAYVNDVASFPSLHAAYPMLIALFFWRSSRWPMRVVLAGYALAMGFTLVYAGEHFVIDILAGWLYALAAWFAIREIFDRWELHRAGRRAVSEPAPHPVAEPASL